MEPTQLAEYIYVEYPAGEITPSTPVVFLNGWTGSKLQYISKYAPLYRDKHYLIFYIETPPTPFPSTNSKDPTTLYFLKPAIDILKALKIDVFSKTSKSHVIIHLFSNGGVVNMLRLGLYLNHNNQFMKISGIIFDSAPSHSKLSSLKSLSNLIYELTLGKSKPYTLEYFSKYVSATASTAFAIPVFVLGPMLGYKTFLIANEDAMYGDRFGKVPRLYMYSKMDNLVTYKEVERHIEDAKKLGDHVEAVRFEDAEHVKLYLKYPKVYAEAVERFIHKAKL